MKIYYYILISILLVCLTSQAFAEGERVDAKYSVGFGSSVKAHYWHNLNVTLTNHYPNRIWCLMRIAHYRIRRRHTHRFLYD